MDYGGSPTLPEALTYCHVITPWGLFPDHHPKPITTPVELIESCHWQKVIGKNPNAWGMINHTWCKILEQFTHN